MITGSLSLREKEQWSYINTAKAIMSEQTKQPSRNYVDEKVKCCLLCSNEKTASLNLHDSACNVQQPDDFTARNSSEQNLNYICDSAGKLAAICDWRSFICVQAVLADHFCATGPRTKRRDAEKSFDKLGCVRKV